MLLKNGFPNGKSDWLRAMGLGRERGSAAGRPRGCRELGWVYVPGHSGVNLPEASGFSIFFFLFKQAGKDVGTLMPGVSPAQLSSAQLSIPLPTHVHSTTENS